MNREELAKYLLDKFPDTLELLETGKAEPFFLMKKPDEIVEFCRAIRDDVELRMDFLCQMCGVDTGENFEVVYSVASVKKRYRFDFKFPCHMKAPRSNRCRLSGRAPTGSRERPGNCTV